MKLIWTKHAEDRQREWEKKLAITRQEVENILRTPEQIVPGDQNLLIAQARRGKGLIRVVFEEVKGGPKILTLYWTSKVQKYWKENLE